MQLKLEKLCLKLNKECDKNLNTSDNSVHNLLLLQLNISNLMI